MKATNEKLELVHLVGYLPYGLKILAYPDSEQKRIVKLVALDSQELFTYGNFDPTWYVSAYDEYDNRGNYGALEIKPILRPLSDLTKEITHNGETFVPMDEINKIHTLEFEDGLFSDYVSSGWSVMWLPYLAIQKLYEWHFDIHGGIGKWAIDLNTIENGK